MFLFAPLVALLAPGAVTDSTGADTAPVAVPRDPTTGQPIIARDATGQPTVQLDATGQPILKTDEEGQIGPPAFDESAARADSLLRNGKGMMLDMNERERLRDGLLGGQDWREQFEVVEGYNSNVIQSQAVVNGPATPHPAMFTGADASAEWRQWTSIHDQQTLRIQVRGQHYESLDGYSEPDDGTVNGGWTGQFTLSPRTYLQGRALVTVSTVNSARLDDGPLFQIDPTSVQRSYTIETARMAVVHELSPRWRWITGADVEVSTTIRDTPVQLSATQYVFHHGLDYVNPGVDTGLFHDFDERNIGSIQLRYDPTYIAYLVDFDHVPPIYNGDTTVEEGDLDLGWVHAFTERLRLSSTVGLIVTSAPPFDTDTRPLESPLVSAELTYVGNYWLATASATYAYGTVNPRLGFGPSVSAATTMQGVPFPKGDLRKLSMLVMGVANRAAFEDAPDVWSRLSFVEGSAEFRYGVSNSLGIVAGYDGRYAVFEGAAAFPKLVRHMVFVGLSGYFATDRVLPTLDTFVTPIKPPG